MRMDGRLTKRISTVVRGLANLGMCTIFLVGETMSLFKLLGFPQADNRSLWSSDFAAPSTESVSKREKPTAIMAQYRVYITITMTCTMIFMAITWLRYRVQSSRSRQTGLPRKLVPTMFLVPVSRGRVWVVKKSAHSISHAVNTLEAFLQPAAHASKLCHLYLHSLR